MGQTFWIIVLLAIILIIVIIVICATMNNPAPDPTELYFTAKQTSGNIMSITNQFNFPIWVEVNTEMMVYLFR